MIEGPFDIYFQNLLNGQFQKNDWKGFRREILEKIDINESSAKRLLELLKIKGDQLELKSKEVLLSAFADSLEYSDEFCKLLNQFTIEDAQKLKEWVHLNHYFASGDFVEDLADLSEDDMEMDDDPPIHFKILLLLFTKCSVFKNQDFLHALGMSSKNITDFTDYMQKKSSMLESKHLEEKETLQPLTSLLESLKNSKYNIMVSEISKLTQRGKFQEAINVATKLQNIYHDIYMNKINIINSKRQKLEDFMNTCGEEQKKVCKTYLSHTSKQLDAIQEAIKLLDKYFEALLLLCKFEVKSVSSQVSLIQVLHMRIVEMSDVFISMIFIGLIKTGKSTIVNSIIGHNLAPNRTEPMTAIPVRYINSQSCTEPIMVVPFAGQLNKVVRRIREYHQKKPIELEFVHLQELLGILVNQKIRFKRIYKGSDVLKYSIYIHDLFRLSVQPKVPPGVKDLLPLEWTKGPNSFLTVFLKFPEFSDSVPTPVTFCVVDTPGVNEAGVQELNLTSVIKKSIKYCHYAAFTLSSLNYGTEENQSLIIDTISYVTLAYKTPTIVFVTRKDQIDTSGSNGGSIMSNAKKFMLEKHDDPSSVDLSLYLVSALQRYVGVNMRAIVESGVIPTAKDENEEVRTLVKNFVSFVEGANEQKKMNNYKKMCEEDIIELCKDLEEASQMEKPLAMMQEKSIKNGIQMSINNMVGKYNEDSNGFKSLLEDRIKLLQQSSETIELIKEKMKTASRDCSRDIEATRKTQQKFVKELISRTQERKDSLISEALGMYSELQTTTEITSSSKEKAQKKLNEIITKASQFLEQVTQKYNEHLAEEVNKWLVSLQEGIKKDISNSLDSVFVEIPDFNSDIKKIKVAEPLTFKFNAQDISFKSRLIHSREKAATITTQVFSVFKAQGVPSTETEFVLSTKDLLEDLSSGMKVLLDTFFSSVCSEINRAANKIVETYFLKVISKFEEVKEMVEDREKAVASGESIKQLQTEILQIEASLNTFAS